MVYYVYKINIIEKQSEYYNCYYIGCRKTNKKIEEDAYFGSSSILKQNNFFTKYPNGYNKEIIEIYDNYEEALKKERELIDIYKSDKYCLNRNCGGVRSDTLNHLVNTTINKVKEKISKSQTGKSYIRTDEYKEKMSRILKGKKRSEEQKINISNAAKKAYKNGTRTTPINFINCNKGKKLSEEHKYKIGGIWRGKHLPEEMKQKISKSLSGKHLSDETKEKLSLLSKGSIWINKDGICKRVKDYELDEYLNNGWIKGRLKKI